MTTIVPLDSQKHQSLSLISNAGYAHIQQSHLLPLTVHEFAMAATNFPIVFVKDAQTGQFKACALVGLKPEQNLFSKNSQWLGSYIPEFAKLHPFVAVKTEANSDKYVICIDESSESLSQKGEGDKLFNDSVASEVLTQRGNAAVAWAQKSELTDAFIRHLLEVEIIQSQSLSISKEDQSYNLTGCYVVNEAALNNLDPQVFMSLKDKGYLAPIYAALLSLNQVGNLLKLAD
ncbi:SapC family protein [Shewanella gaetbuli]